VTLNANCIFLGSQQKEVIDRTLKASRFFILLSQYEGLSFALLEAMAAGIVPIVSDVKGNLDVVTDGFNSLVAPLCSLQELPNRVKDLLDDQPRMEKLGDNALATVRKKYQSTDRISDMIELILTAQ
jgi:glycosyltransferase involved in cell wall biosynthesis